jgi:heat shock protein HslJ
MRTLLLFGLLLATAACRRPSTRLKSTLTPVTVNPQPADYSAYLRAGDDVVVLGNNPSWSLRINPTKNTLRFKTLAGDSISTSAPERITDSNGGFRYTTDVAAGRLTATFRPDSCVDALSGQRFDYRVDVAVQGKTYTGCGVSLRSLALLQDIWVLTELNGKPVTATDTGRERPRLEINLTESRATGTTGCNRFNGRVRADTRLIQFGPLATTRMACLNNTGVTETMFLGILESPLTYQVGEGTLTLFQAGKPVLVFKKVD